MSRAPVANVALAVLGLLLASPLPGLGMTATELPGPSSSHPPETFADASDAESTLAQRLATQDPSPLRNGLSALGGWLGLPELDGQALVASPSLGLTDSATGLVARYGQEAAAQDAPLVASLLAWNAALGLQDPTALAADPALAQAAALPRDLQLPLAVLLHALTDATLLQRQAVANVPQAGYAKLLEAPAEAVAGRLDPETEEGQHALADLHAAAASVDQGLLHAASALMAAAVDATLPDLRDATARPTVEQAGADPQITAFIAAHAGADAGTKDPIQRLAAAADALRLAADLAGISALQEPAARGASGEHPLASAIMEWAALSGTRWQDAAPQLVQADGLPGPLQEALAAVILAALDWQTAILAFPDPQDDDAFAAYRSRLLGTQVALLAAVERSAPTIEAWGLVWSHGGLAALPATPAHEAQAFAALARSGEAAAGGDLQALLALARPGLVPSQAPETSTGSFADAVLETHRLLGEPDDEAAASKVRADAGALPAAVERSAARILWAEVDALRALEGLTASLTEADLAILDGGVDPALLEAPVSLEDVQRLRALYALADRIQAVYLDGAAGIDAAVAASTDELQASATHGFEDAAPAKAKPPGSWLGRLGRGLANWPIASASAQSVPATPDPLCGPGGALATTPDCANNIWFRSSRIIIAGPGSSKIDLTTGAGATLFQLDLGGDDEYRNNAGGAGYTMQLGTIGYAVQPAPNAAPYVAVSFDLAGDDQYLPPAGPNQLLPIDLLNSAQDKYGYRSPDGLQGAGEGGIGLLFDAAGNDAYQARAMSQGYARGYTSTERNPATSRCTSCVVLYGVGALVDAAGDDSYRATTTSQGAAEAGVTATTDVSQANPILVGGPFYKMPIPHPLAPIGALLDSGGNDEYRLAPAAKPPIGQGGAQAGLGILVDGAGDDVYRNGMQGTSVGGIDYGIGALVDLGGTDTYTRKPAATFHDEACWASTRSPQGAPLGPAGSPLARDIVAFATSGNGVFIDTDPGAPCAVDVARLLPAGLGAPGDAGDDNDGDGWLDLLERLDLGQGGLDDTDAQDYPAGAPDAAAWCRASGLAPEAACAALDLGTPGDRLPHGSTYLVRIPGLLAIGDAVANVHQAATASDVGRDYAVLLDIAGADIYRNRVGGAPALLPTPASLDVLAGRALEAVVPNSAASPFQSFAADFGGNDAYRSDAPCVQGCNGMLLDVGGSDVYEAKHTGAVGCPCMAQGGTALGTPGTASLLFDADGDDQYLRPPSNVRDFGQGAVTATYGGVGILLDAAGSDIYQSPTQGFSDSLDAAIRRKALDGVNTPPQYVGPGETAALFLDLSGSDAYSPVGKQGVVESIANPVLLPAPANSAPPAKTGNALFLDANGRDRYQGTVTHPQGTDFSGFLNNRIRGSQLLGAVGVFWDQDRVGASPNVEPGHALADPVQALDLRGLGIAIGTDADEVYPGNYALLYDPGGNDVYLNNAGATLLRAQFSDDPAGSRDVAMNPADFYPVASLLVDAAGDDTYLAPDEPGLAPSGLPVPQVDANQLQNPNAGALLMSMLPTANGVLAQGTGVLGVGILQDTEGDDRYVARGFAQGSEFLGVGILWDRAGDDEYHVDADVARAPVASGRAVAWQELTQGQWRIKARFAESAFVCQVSLPSARGPATDIALEVLDLNGGEARVAYSQYDTRVGVWRVTTSMLDLDACPFTPPTSSVAQVTNVPSHQRRAALAKDLILWEDSRNGDLDIYARGYASPAELDVDQPIVGLRGSNQTHPDVSGNWLAWQDDRDGNGGSAVYLLNLKTPSLANRISAPQVPGAVRQDVAPRVSDSFIVWQSRTCDAALAECGPWDLVALNRQVADPAKQVCRLSLGRDLVQPDVAGDAIVVMDEEREAFLRYSWLPGCVGGASVIHEHASSGSLDRQSVGRLAWKSTVQPQQTNEEALERPAGSPYHEIMKGTLKGKDPQVVSNLVARLDERFLQGAAFMPGLGLALDEAGNDRFLAGVHSQGASFAMGTAKPAPGPGSRQVTPMTSVGAHGVLLNLAGNDAFTALQHSQGADLGASLRYMASAPPPGSPIPAEPTPLGYGEAASNLALLLSLRGSNVYTANSRSQGFAALAGGVLTSSPSPPRPGEDPSTEPPQVYASGSVGALVDLGGRDAYRYHPINPTEVPCDHVVDDLSALLRGVGQGLLSGCQGLVPESTEGNDRIVLQGVGRADPNGDRCQNSPPYSCQQTCEVSQDPGTSLPELNQDPGTRPLCEHVVGGVRVDLPAIDLVDAPVTQQANDRLLTVSVKAFEGDRDLLGGPEAPGLPGRGTLRLVASVDPKPGAGVRAQVNSVEFFLGSQFIGYGRQVGETTAYEIPLDTESAAIPDAASYDVSARALFHTAATSQAQSTPLGYADGFLRLRIDNPAQIILPTLQRDPPCAIPCFFSPEPWADDAPAPPVLAFGLNPDVAGPESNRGYALVSVLDAAGDVVADLRPSGSPAAPGAWPVGPMTQQVLWDGRLQAGPQAGTSAPPGIYRLRISASDWLEPGAGPATLDADRVVVAEDALVRVESRVPAGGCVVVLPSGGLPPSSCNPHLSVNSGNSEAGRTQTRVTLRFGYDLASSPSPGPAHLFMADALPSGELPAASQWTEVPVVGTSASIVLDQGARRHFAVLFEDAAGNLECVPQCGGLVGEAPVGVAILDALANKFAGPDLGDLEESPVAALLEVDIERPALLLGKGGFPVHVDGKDHAAKSVVRVGPESEVRLSYLVRKTPATEVPHGRVTWTALSGIDPGQDPACFTRVYDDVTLEPIVGSNPPLYQSTWDDWEDLLTPPAGSECQPWPQGGIAWTLDAFDPAGNQASPNFGGLVVLDRTAPDLPASGRSVTYPDGRLHALRNDALVLTLKATDPSIPPLPNLAPNLLKVSFDASSLVDPAVIAASLAATQQAAAERQVDPCLTAPAEHPGLVDFLFCYSAEAKAFQARIPFDPRAGLDPDLLQAQPVPVPVTVVDPVGNTAQATFIVAVGAPNIGVQPGHADVGIGFADLRYYTVRAAAAVMQIGLDPDFLTEVTPQIAAPGELHEFHVDGLEPGKTYFHRLVATDPASGAREAGPLGQFRVPQGVHVAITEPKPGGTLSGLSDVRVDAGILMRPGAEPFVRLTMVRPDGLEPDTPLLEGQTSDGVAALRLVTDSHLDGLYDLVATAIFEQETAQVRVERVLVDNTPPMVKLLAPAPDDVVAAAPTQLVLRLQDGASGFCTAGGGPCLRDVAIRLGSARFDAKATVVRDAAGLGGVMVVPVPDGLALRGAIAVQATVADAAGNPGSTLTRFFVDADAPVVASTAVVYPDGQESVRAGQAVRVLVGLTDASGVARAVADLRPAGGPAEVQMLASPIGHAVDVRVPSNATSGALTIPVRATDRAGNVLARDVVVRVDGTPPLLHAVATNMTGLEAATVALNASEPVRAMVTVRQGGIVWGRFASQGFVAGPKVNLTGLRPGNVYDLDVAVTDRAGNQANTTTPFHFAPLVLDPSPATGLTARAVPGGIRLLWDVPLDAIAFRFRVLRSDGGPFMAIAETSEADYLDTSVERGVTYRYAVETINLVGAAAAPSPEAAARPGVAPRLDPAVSPMLGRARQTEFVFRATLRDAQDAAPRAWLRIGNASYAMDPPVGDCRQECTLRRAVTLPALDLRTPEVRYAIEVLDGGQMLRGPGEGTLAGPEVLAADAVPPARFGHGAPSIGLVLLAVAILFAAQIRRRTS